MPIHPSAHALQPLGLLYTNGDVGRDQIQAKMHLYMHKSAYIYKHLYINKYEKRCNKMHIYIYIYKYIFSSGICIQIFVYMAAYGHTYLYLHYFGT